MICPYCNKAIHFKVENRRDYPNVMDLDYLYHVDSCDGIGVMEGFCPSCSEFMILLLEGNYDTQAKVLDTVHTTVIYPSR